MNLPFCHSREGVDTEFSQIYLPRQTDCYELSKNAKNCIVRYFSRPI